MAGKRGNNEGSIYKRKDGAWCAGITLDNGKRRVLYGKSRDEVAGKLTDALKLQRDGLPLFTDRQTVAAYLAEWLTGIEPTLKPPTWQR